MTHFPPRPSLTWQQLYPRLVFFYIYHLETFAAGFYKLPAGHVDSFENASALGCRCFFGGGITGLASANTNFVFKGGLLLVLVLTIVGLLMGEDEDRGSDLKTFSSLLSVEKPLSSLLSSSDA